MRSLPDFLRQTTRETSFLQQQGFQEPLNYVILWHEALFTKPHYLFVQSTADHCNTHRKVSLGWKRSAYFKYIHSYFMIINWGSCIIHRTLFFTYFGVPAKIVQWQKGRLSSVCIVYIISAKALRTLKSYFLIRIG